MKHVVEGPAPTQRREKSSGVSDIWFSMQRRMRIRISKTRFVALLAFLTLLLAGSLFVLSARSDVYAAHQNINGACIWYHVLPGDTLDHIARRYHTAPQSLARVNHVSNNNHILVGRNLCIANKAGPRPGSGLLPNGAVRTYAYSALERSSRSQVSSLLRRAAARQGLPANLLLAIAWQESGWQQHVISHDGGIGTMQLMPYTATRLDTQTHKRYDPYKLADNITLGAIYLRSLWRGLHGNLTKVISGYNEGGWNVVHRGILNQRYVNNVLALMHRF